MPGYIIASATPDDITAIRDLYLAVAGIEGGLARTADEVSEEYVSGFLGRSLAGGIILVARQTETRQIIGEIHSYRPGPKVFSHVLGELTIAVHPAYQGQGTGRALFSELMLQVQQQRQDILRVELIARESNQKAIEFYRRLGFQVEGRMTDRIRSIGGGYEADIPMAWYRSSAQQKEK